MARLVLELAFYEGASSACVDPNKTQQKQQALSARALAAT
jgi:hypothetical protein